MSSGEEFEIEEILEQRKRKGLVEYLVRWRGFNELYDSWEPAAALVDCSKALKAFAAKLKSRRSRSKSRSRSRGRASKSRSRSTSRGRKTKSDATPKRSRSRSGGRTSTKSSSSISSSKLVSDVKVTTKEESSSVELRKPLKLRSEPPAVEKKAAVAATSSRSEKVVEKTSSTKERGEPLVQKTEVVKTTVETVKSTPSSRMEGSGMTTRSRLAVRQVANDQKAPKATPKATEEKGTWWWWFADHAVLILFIIVSLIALSFTIESISGVRDKLIPDLGVLRQRLGESYDHFVQGVSSVCSNVYDMTVLGFSRIKGAVFSAEETPASSQSKVPPPSPKA